MLILALKLYIIIIINSCGFKCKVYNNLLGLPVCRNFRMLSLFLFITDVVLFSLSLKQCTFNGVSAFKQLV